jgi:hypothetical protein
MDEEADFAVFSSLHAASHKDDSRAPPSDPKNRISAPTRCRHVNNSSAPHTAAALAGAGSAAPQQQRPSGHSNRPLPDNRSTRICVFPSLLRVCAATVVLFCLQVLRRGLLRDAAVGAETRSLSLARADFAREERLAIGRASSALAKEHFVEGERLGTAATGEVFSLADADSIQEAKNWPNIDWQDQIHRGILRVLRNISETP